MKMKFAVIGHPVAHSLSPKMHQANFKAIGFDGTYEEFDVAPEDVASFVREKQREGYAGLNVTVPHKLAVIPLLDHVDVSVARYGACNTLKFEADGTITGYNTDVIGFVEGLAAHGFALTGKRVFIVGCGGAGSALATACCYEKAASLVLADLDAAVAAKAAGVGLYRTEFPFLMRQSLPSEADQAAIYARVLARMPDRPVTVRTLDAGGDKFRIILGGHERCVRKEVGALFNALDHLLVRSAMREIDAQLRMAFGERQNLVRIATGVLARMELHGYVALLQHGEDAIKVFRALLHPWRFKFVDLHALEQAPVENLEVRIGIVERAGHPVERMRTGTERRLRFARFALDFRNCDVPLAGDGREDELVHPAAFKHIRHNLRLVVEVATVEGCGVRHAVEPPDVDMSVADE